MKNKKCPKPRSIILYYDDRLSSRKRRRISNHLKGCKKCSGYLETLKTLDELLEKKNKNMSKSYMNKQKGCITDELLYRYLEKTLSDSELKKTEQHLNSCDVCLNEVSSLIRCIKIPATKQELMDIEKIRNITPEEQVEKIVSTVQAAKAIKPAVTSDAKEETKTKFEIMINKIRYAFKFIAGRHLKPVIAIFVLVILTGVIYKGVDYYKTDYQVNQAVNTMSTHHRTFIEDSRLSGGYRSRGISMLMGPEDESEHYLKKTKKLLQKAFKNGINSQKAKQLLAHVYIIENNFEKADSVLTDLYLTGQQDATLFNDMGVLYFQERQWKTAEENFKRALKLNNRFPEAYFNLALVKMKLNDPNQALTAIERCIEHETDKNWINAALRIKNIIIKNKDS